MNQSDFPPGTRVRFRTHPRGQELVSLGALDLYMHLNARMYVSGVVLPGTPRYWADSLFIRPDGWPLPEGVAPAGFAAAIERLERYDGEDLTAPITNGICKPVTPDEVSRRVNEYLTKRK